jgi:hypothetical protein
VLVCVLLGPARGEWSAGIAVAVLLVQLAAVRPRLTRRTDAVLAGGPSSKRSHAHLVYVGLELIKVVALLVTGVMLLP